jgi:hypothetical protein
MLLDFPDFADSHQYWNFCPTLGGGYEFKLEISGINYQILFISTTSPLDAKPYCTVSLKICTNLRDWKEIPRRMLGNKDARHGCSHNLVRDAHKVSNHFLHHK